MTSKIGFGYTLEHIGADGRSRTYKEVIMASKIGFVYTLEHIGADGKVLSSELIDNIIPIVGLDYMIGSAFKGTSQFTAFYLGVFGTNYAPAATDTMTTLIASCGELSSYGKAARDTITFPAISSSTITTVASPNEFTFAAGETIRGAFISSSPTLNGTAGLLVSAVLFPSPKVLSAGDTLRVPVGFSLASV